MKLKLGLWSLFTAALPVFAGPDWLAIDFSNPRDIGAQTIPSLPSATPYGDIGFATGQPGIADFGVNGFLKLENFVQPTRPFSIEAHFILHDYGIENSHFLSNILSTVFPHQGAVLRIGGGSLYPILTEGGTQNPPLWAQSLEQTVRNRELISACVAAVAAPTTNGRFIESYTRSCIELNVWNHLVATWDGTLFHLYLNANEVTDSTRLVGRGLTPNQVPVAPLYIGARSDDGTDSRHFNGRMNFVRVIDGALTGREIRRRYRQLPEMPRDNFQCHGTVTPNPATVHGACEDRFARARLGRRDSLEVQFSHSPDYHDPFLTYRISEKYFRYFDHVTRGGLNPTARTYWRARIVKYNRAAPKMAAETSILNWNGVDPMRVAAEPDAPAPRLFRLDGSQATLHVAKENGFWILNPVKAKPGLFLVR